MERSFITCFLLHPLKFWTDRFKCKFWVLSAAKKCFYISKAVKVCERSESRQGSMLWSQFSAIFANFLRKNWRFCHKMMLWSIFFKNSFSLSKKLQHFCQIFRRNIWKIITSAPGSGRRSVAQETCPALKLGIVRIVSFYAQAEGHS
jgi:hypothetical protein